MRKIPTVISVSGLALLISLSASAQSPLTGKPGAWTHLLFEENHTGYRENPLVRVVRASRQGTFDRVVFQFERAFPNYRIEYLRSHFYASEDGKHRIRIVGRLFLKIDLSQIAFEEKQIAFSKAKGFYPTGRFGFPTLMAMEDMGVDEGHDEFLLGLSSRKPFRVTELANPFRLVIDIRH